MMNRISFLAAISCTTFVYASFSPSAHAQWAPMGTIMKKTKSVTSHSNGGAAVATASETSPNVTAAATYDGASGNQIEFDSDIDEVVTYTQTYMYKGAATNSGYIPPAVNLSYSTNLNGSASGSAFDLLDNGPNQKQSVDPASWGAGAECKVGLDDSDLGHAGITRSNEYASTLPTSFQANPSGARSITIDTKNAQLAYFAADVEASAFGVIVSGQAEPAPNLIFKGNYSATASTSFTFGSLQGQ